jgi:glycosyltransferase involved in cell wall biosynthesis
MLRVAHVLNSPGRGGVPRVAHALVQHAAAHGIAPHVFYLKDGGGPDPFDGIGIPLRVAQSASKANAMTELIAFLDRHRIEVLHTHSYRPNLYARMAGAVLRPGGLRIVAHYHNDYSASWAAEELLLERQLVAVTDAGLAVSAAVAGHVARDVGLVCDVAPNGIDQDRVTGGDRAAGRALFGARPGDFVVGLIGRVCRQKGVDTFVEAAIACLSDRPEAFFVIVGDLEDATLIRALSARIAEAGLAHRIVFTGHCEEIADVLAALDLLVAPSRWEGFGLMLAEAMAAGVPIVASDVGGISETAGDAAVLVPPDAPGALAAAILSLGRDPDRRIGMAGAGRVRGGKFDWALTAGIVAETYSRVMCRA